METLQPRIRACVVYAQERFSLQNQDLRNGTGQSLRGLFNREMSFIRPGYRRGTERYLRDPYQPAAKVSTSLRAATTSPCQ